MVHSGYNSSSLLLVLPRDFTFLVEQIQRTVLLSDIQLDITMRREDLILRRLYRALAEEGTDDGDYGSDSHSEFGVHVTYEDLYSTVVFFACIYICGQIASNLLKMPSLVGEIICGILLGPPLANFVPNPEAFVLIGETG